MIRPAGFPLVAPDQLAASPPSGWVDSGPALRLDSQAACAPASQHTSNRVGYGTPPPAAPVPSASARIAPRAAGPDGALVNTLRQHRSRRDSRPALGTRAAIGVACTGYAGSPYRWRIQVSMAVTAAAGQPRRSTRQSAHLAAAESGWPASDCAVRSSSCSPSGPASRISSMRSAMSWAGPRSWPMVQSAA